MNKMKIKTVFKNLIIIFLILIGGVIFILSNQLGGFRTFIVSSGSMEPTIPTGALVITSYTHPQNIKQGDVITFLPPTTKREFVTHRITKVTNDKSLSLFKTKGDGNQHEDNWTIAGGAVVGKVIFTIPYLGYIFAFMQNKIVLILCVLLPTIYIVLSELQNIVHIFKQNKKRKISESTITGSCLLLFIYALSFSSQSTHALLTDTASIPNNVISTNLINHDGDDEDDGDNKKNKKKHKPHKPKHHNKDDQDEAIE